jgi:hypothetical protein
MNSVPGSNPCVKGIITELFGFLDEKPVMYRASLQILDPALPAAAEALITIQKTDVAETTTWIRPAAPAVQLSLF